jgi:hypothetical protein
MLNEMSLTGKVQGIFRADRVGGAGGNGCCLRCDCCWESGSGCGKVKSSGYLFSSPRPPTLYPLLTTAFSAASGGASSFSLATQPAGNLVMVHNVVCN